MKRHRKLSCPMRFPEKNAAIHKHIFKIVFMQSTEFEETL